MVMYAYVCGRGGSRDSFDGGGRLSFGAIFSIIDGTNYGRMKKYKKTYNGRQNTTQKTK